MREGPFERDGFLVKQLFRPMVSLYEVFGLAEDGRSAGERVAFVRQKRMALREDLRAFTDESEREEVFRIKARSVVEIGGRYDVAAPDASPLGTLEKQFGRSLLRSTWRIVDPQGSELMTATERSLAIAIARRIKDLVPYGELLPLRYHFTFARSGVLIGELRRVLGLRDQYVLEVTGDPDREIDRRLVVALAIALDALQAR